MLFHSLPFHLFLLTTGQWNQNFSSFLAELKIATQILQSLSLQALKRRQILLINFFLSQDLERLNSFLFYIFWILCSSEPLTEGHGNHVIWAMDSIVWKHFLLSNSFSIDTLEHVRFLSVHLLASHVNLKFLISYCLLWLLMHVWTIIARQQTDIFGPGYVDRCDLA